MYRSLKRHLTSLVGEALFSINFFSLILQKEQWIKALNQPNHRCLAKFQSNYWRLLNSKSLINSLGKLRSNRYFNNFLWLTLAWIFFGFNVRLSNKKNFRCIFEDDWDASWDLKSPMKSPFWTKLNKSEHLWVLQVRLQFRRSHSLLVCCLHFKNSFSLGTTAIPSCYVIAKLNQSQILHKSLLFNSTHKGPRSLP